ncbi:MAG: hypothetical protein NTX49_04570 [Chlamydiae bacterium]|nr:hypothetical protein [Chlamydiota bacterium]
MIPLAACDSKLSPAHVSISAPGAVATIPSAPLDARVSASSLRTIASAAADGSSLSEEAVASLYREFGLDPTVSNPEPGKMPRSEAELWMRAYEGEGGSSSGCGSSVPREAASRSLKSILRKGSRSPAEAPRPCRLSFSPDTRDERSSAQYMLRCAEAMAAKVLETFDTLSSPNPSQQEIAKLFENQVSIGLWNKQYSTFYRHQEDLFSIHRLSIVRIGDAFYDVLNGAVEEVARTEKIEFGFLYIDEYLGDVLDKAFIPDEEFPDQKAAEDFFLRHDMEVLGLCFPIMSEMLDHPPVRSVLEVFFSESLG